MFYIPIQKDFSNVKTKVAFGLTKRQLICFGLGAVIGITAYFLLKSKVPSDIAGVIMIIMMLPFFVFGQYEKNGMTLEVIIKNVIKEKYLRPQIRVVKTEPLIMGIMQTAEYVKESEKERKEEKDAKIQLF